jgi:hypothetical protein
LLTRFNKGDFYAFKAPERHSLIDGDHRHLHQLLADLSESGGKPVLRFGRARSGDL